MRYFTFLAATLVALAPGIAHARPDAAPEQRFVHDGATYVYTTSTAPHGRQIISGQRLDDGYRFRLVVAGDRVSGTSGGAPVSFRVAEAQGATRAD